MSDIMPLSKTKRITFRLLAVLGAVCVTLLAIEIGLRIYYGKVERITGVAEWTTSEDEGITYYWDQYHPRYGWTNLPGYRSDDRVPFRVTINSQSLRSDRDYQFDPPTGRRVALFGDSFAFGEEVDDDQTVAAFLESHLSDVEVLNFGVHGYGVGQMVFRLEDEVFDFHPSRVLLMITTMDFLRDPMDELVHPKPAFGIQDGTLHVRNQPVPELSRRPWIERHSFLAAMLSGIRPIPAHELAFGYRYYILRLLLERARDACERHGVPLTVIHITDGPTLDELADPSHPSHETVFFVNKSLKEAQVEVLDLTPFISEQYEQHGQQMEAPNRHWSALGNRLLAEQIAQYLHEQHPGWQSSPSE